VALEKPAEPGLLGVAQARKGVHLLQHLPGKLRRLSGVPGPEEGEWAIPRFAAITGSKRPGAMPTANRRTNGAGLRLLAPPPETGSLPAAGSGLWPIGLVARKVLRGTVGQSGRTAEVTCDRCKRKCWKTLPKKVKVL
jgi:hypothetical protein